MFLLRYSRLKLIIITRLVITDLLLAFPNANNKIISPVYRRRDTFALSSFIVQSAYNVIAIVRVFSVPFLL